MVKLSLLLLFAIPGSATSDKQPFGGQNATELYHLVWKELDQRLTPEQSVILRQYQVIFVPGILSDFMLRLNRSLLTSWLAWSRYFDDQMEWLAGMNVNNKRLDMKSEFPAAFNVGIIRQAVDASPQAVILISHSKGSTDVLEFLRLNPQLRRRVRGWISFQGPFHGAGDADVWSAPPKRALTKSILRAIGGSMDSVDELRTGDRAAYMARYDAEIREIAREIPVLCLTTAESGAAEKELWKGILPDSHYVSLQGISHKATILEERPANFDRVRMTKTFLRMLLEGGHLVK